MAEYLYRCSAGHLTSNVRSMKEPTPKRVRCCKPGCRRLARRSLQDEHAGNRLVVPDVPEHFNLTIGMPVRSRRHLKDLQKRHGFQDYEGMHGASQSQVFGPGGEIRRLKHSERVHG